MIYSHCCCEFGAIAETSQQQGEGGAVADEYVAIAKYSSAMLKQRCVLMNVVVR